MSALQDSQKDSGVLRSPHVALAVAEDASEGDPSVSHITVFCKKRKHEESGTSDKDDKSKSPVKGAQEKIATPAYASAYAKPASDDAVVVKQEMKQEVDNIKSGSPKKEDNNNNSGDGVKKAKQEQLDKLKEEIKKDVNLPLASSMLVFGRGDPTAQIVFIGEAPGENEELYGVPFTGPSGRLLNQLLVDMGFAMDNNTYICNVLKYRPPDNRDPTAKEVQMHTPYLIRQLDIIAPKLIIPLGNWATKYVLSGFDPKKMNKIDGMSKVHGQKFVVASPRGDVFNVIPAFHPAAALHNKQWDPALRDDFLKIKLFVQSEEFLKKPTIGGADSTSPVKKQKTLDSFFGGGGGTKPITSFFGPKK